MSRLTRHNSGNRSRRSAPLSGSRSIPDIFKSQSQSRRHKAQSKMAQLRGEEEFSKDNPPPDHPLMLTAMKKIAADIKGTFSAAITNLKADILSISEKLEGGRDCRRQIRQGHYSPRESHRFSFSSPHRNEPTT